MANSELKDKKANLSDDIISFLKKIKLKYQDKNTEIADNFINNKVITYQYSKKLKNFFDTFEGDKNSYEYEIRGGDLMKSFVESWLNTNRSSVDNSKKIRKDSGIENVYLKKHDRDRSSNIMEPIKIPVLEYVITKKQYIYLIEHYAKRA
jgi:hypothetical protein